MAGVTDSTKAKKKRLVVLIIRDGWGVNPRSPEHAEEEGDATHFAQTPIDARLQSSAPHATLDPSGESVGLPAGQMGNSEVGHLNLGAGRIVYQSLTRISRAIREGEFFQSPVLKELTDHLKKNGGRLHVMGLCSDGGVHSHLEHLFAVLELARRAGLSRVFIHCFTDGRDTSPTSGAGYIRQIQDKIRELGVGTIATITGRYYAMDRDKRWERVSEAYRAIVDGVGPVKDDPVATVEEYYATGKTDEFLPATVIRNTGVPAEEQKLRDGDGVLFFNFRADRARQLTHTLTDPKFDGFDRGTPRKVHFVCMTEYDETFTLPIVFPPEQMKNILAEVLAANGLKQFRIAETEKYAHVTYFFNGGVEEPYAGEDRMMIPSPKVATYDLKPEMSAAGVTEELIARLESGKYDAVIVNYANPDMVGHTGSIPAAIKAVETVDACVGRVLDTLRKIGGAALVTADHGNAEKMKDEEGKPFTAHTTFPVNIFYVADDQGKWELRHGILADVAPTMLHLLGIPVPAEMTGTSLLVPRG